MRPRQDLGQSLSRHPLAAVALALLLAPGIFPLRAAIAQEASPTPLATPITIGTSYALPSKALGEEREINVWLPPSYAKGDQRYPVLYVIDGGLEQDFHHISGLAQLATINGAYAELIVVGVATKNRVAELTTKPSKRRYARLAPDAGKSEQFRTHLATEVIPFIEGRYRVTPRRALIGESLAGLFIVETFLKQPNLFTDYIAISPSLWWDGRSLAKQAPTLLEKHDEAARRLYLTMADEGGAMQEGLDILIAALQGHQPHGLDWSYVDRRESEHHNTIYHGAAHDALGKLFAIAPAREEPPAKAATP